MMMRRVVAGLLALLSLSVFAAEPKQPASGGYALIIHGGAGTLQQKDLSKEALHAIRTDISRALDAGDAVLRDGGSSLDAINAALVIMEDSPQFNAGRGAVFNAEGVNEMDASIMDGRDQRAGAVAGVHRVKNPIKLARAVMEKSRHVMLAGDGAEVFARQQGIELVDPSYFRTESRWEALQRAKAAEQPGANVAQDKEKHFGTVGAVALDRDGHIAAATSTGGMTNKRWGRIGDSPIIGAGTWADDRCGVSATGWGEYFIRLGITHDICARVRYAGQSLQAAADEVIQKRLPEAGGNGGIIAIDRDGHVVASFDTANMVRAWIDKDGSRHIAMFEEELPTEQRGNLGWSEE
ncbi:MAG TPA: isoaspartyl peptidase/L-asparaginase [Xanthomonadaceae bacterium]|nr:isoaspartyl peptidase/L-asparaginase [Xanthomonadaceae bacterium]